MSETKSDDAILRHLMLTVDLFLQSGRYREALYTLEGLANANEKVGLTDKHKLIIHLQTGKLYLDVTKNTDQARIHAKRALQFCSDRETGAPIDLILESFYLLIEVYKTDENVPQFKDITDKAIEYSIHTGSMEWYCRIILNAVIFFYRQSDFEMAFGFLATVRKQFDLNPNHSMEYLEPRTFFLLLQAHLCQLTRHPDATKALLYATKEFDNLPDEPLNVFLASYCATLNLCHICLVGSYDHNHSNRWLEILKKCAQKPPQTKKLFFRKLHWLEPTLLDILFQLFDGVQKESIGEVDSSDQAFLNGLKKLQAGKFSSTNAQCLLFLLQTKIIASYFSRGDIKEGSSMLSQLLLEVEQNETLPLRKYRATILHDLCAHYACLSGMLVQSKNQLKRSYRKAELEVAPKRYARLQLAVLKLMKHHGDEVCQKEYQKANEDIVKIITDCDRYGLLKLKAVALIALGYLQQEDKSCEPDGQEMLKASLTMSKPDQQKLGNAQLVISALILLGKFYLQNDLAAASDALVTSLSLATRMKDLQSQLLSSRLLTSVYIKLGDDSKVKQYQAEHEKLSSNLKQSIEDSNDCDYSSKILSWNSDGIK